MPSAITVAHTPAPMLRSSARSRAAGVGAVLGGILLVALNLRVAITSLGALLPEVSQGLRLTPGMAGLATMLPAICFAAFGVFTPRLARRFSSAQILVGSMAVLAIGQGARILTDSAWVFLITSALALAGIAVANVLLPALVKEHFPTRAGAVTGIYTMTMIMGSATGAAASVPIAEAYGSWRAGLGAWAVIAAVAAIPWIGRITSGRAARPSAAGGISTAAAGGIPAAAAGGISAAAAGGISTAAAGGVAVADGAGRVRVRPWRTGLGWAMAVYFGLQSLSGYATMGWLAQIFRDASYSPSSAGLLLAALPAFGMPIALLMPAIAGRRSDLRPLVLVMSAAMVLSYAGLALSPHDGAVVWVALLAIGQGAFPLGLAVIGMRARTGAGIVALSAFAQSVGYLIAALGPLTMGLLHEYTGGWTIPLGFLIVAAVLQTFAGLAIARPGFIEDRGAVSTR